MKHSQRARLTGIIAVTALLLPSSQSLSLRAQSTSRTSLESARALAVAGRTDDALAIYDAMLSKDVADRSALLGSATALAWARRFTEAHQRYAQLLERWPSDVEVLQGLARLESWSGQLAHSEDRWRALALRDSLNPDLWVELAQVMRWRGALRDAQTSLARALTLAPTHTRALAESVALRATRATVVTPILRLSRDSEGNSLTTITMGVELPLESRRAARIMAYGRGAALGATAGESRALRASMQLPLGMRSLLLVEAGGVQLAGADSDERTRALGAVRMRSEVAPWLTMHAAISRDVLDETAPMIRSTLTSNAASLTVALRPGADWVVTTSGDVVRIKGTGAPNSRRQWQSSVERAFPASLSAGVRLWRTTHSREAADGYFSPRQQDLGELLGRWAPQSAFGWQPRIEAALGQQRIALADVRQSGPSHRLDASFAYRWRSGGELSLGYERSSVAGLVPIEAGRAASYRFEGFRAGSRFPM